MKANFYPGAGVTMAGVLLAILTAPAVQAQSFSYTIESNRAAITGFASGTEPTGAVVVPATLGGAPVTEIGRAAFRDRAGITSIRFEAGASVTKLGVAAFQGCTALEAIELPQGASALPAGLLQGCVRLNSVSLPAAVTTIGAAAFADCRSLTTLELPAALTDLGDAVFAGCRSLTALSVPAGIRDLPAELCSDCEALQSLSLPDGIEAIGRAAFAGCAVLDGTLVLPAATRSVGAEAFRGCSVLEGISLGAALETVGERAFDESPALASIAVAEANATFSSREGVLYDKAQATVLRCPEGRSGALALPSTVTTIGEGAFAHCSGLEAVELPMGVTQIGGDAFYYARSINRAPLGDGVVQIGAWAFAACDGLRGVTLPAGIVSVGERAFAANPQLSWALFEGNAPQMGAAVFEDAAEDFTIYYYPARSGFSTPLWLGYAALPLERLPELVSWLTANGYAPGAELETAPAATGVPLLLSYALGLDPNANPVAALPQAVLVDGQLQLSFTGDRAGIGYAVEASSDLSTWSTEEVVLTAADTEGLRTASIAAGDGVERRFLRIVVYEE